MNITGTRNYRIFIVKRNLMTINNTVNKVRVSPVSLNMLHYAFGFSVKKIKFFLKG